MVSRDTRVQLVAVGLGFGSILLATFANVPFDGVRGLALGVSSYGLALGGAHLYLALRHDDGLVPVESRWRYVTALAIVLLSATAIGLAGDRPAGPTDVGTIGLGVIAVTAVGYLLAEATSGYRDSRPS